MIRNQSFCLQNQKKSVTGALSQRRLFLDNEGKNRVELTDVLALKEALYVTDTELLEYVRCSVAVFA